MLTVKPLECRRSLPAFFFSSLFLLCCHSSFAQPIKIHCDMGIQYSHFHGTELIGVSDGRPGASIRFGAAYQFGKNDQFAFGAEMGGQVRRMKRSIDDYYFINRFFTLETPVFLRIALSDQWSAEAGMALLFTIPDQSELRGTESTTRIMLGNGFKGFDVAPYIGGSYQFSEHLSAGGRARFGMLPMVEYQTVGDFGSISPVQRDLYSTTFEIFLRISTF